MANDKFKKKKGMSKEAWLDWLSDDAPAVDAQTELRQRYKQQANSYQPRDRTVPQSQAAPTAPTSPVAPIQPQAVTQTPPVAKPAPTAPKTAAPATVSIQIQLPSFESKRLKQLKARLERGWEVVRRWITSAKSWLQAQYGDNKARTLVVSIGLAVVIIGLFIPPLFNFGYGKSKDTASSGGASGSSAGATAKYDKPPFTVVRPSNKPKLATPDGVHAAYDGARNTYSYSDAIGGNGFTVSQQPLPAQFKDGQAAIDAIGPTLNKGVAPVTLTSITGPAAVSTNPKYNSQTVVASVRDLLVFIVSSHSFKNSEWQDYLNTLQ